MIIDYINRYKDFRPDFPDGNTNHLPMALYAIYMLGGSFRDLESFAKEYTLSHNLQNSSSESYSSISITNWSENLGNRKYYEDYRNFYKAELLKLGRDKCVEIYFHRLVQGVASEAFHCFIKLAYAVESNNDQEVINSLSYLSSTIFTTPVYSQNLSDGLISIETGIDKLKASVFFQNKKFNKGNIASRIKEVFQDEDFIKYIFIPDFSEKKHINRLRNYILKYHLLKWNFTSLHLVTSLHAIRTLVRYTSSPELVYRNYWVAVLGSMVTLNSIPNQKNDFSISWSIENWEILFRKAVESMDDHIIKFVYSCYEEYKLSGNYLYQMAASRSIYQ